MNVLVGCEESQAVCIEFREKGHNAFSCDIIECSGGHPEWHIKQSVLELLNGRCLTMIFAAMENGGLTNEQEAQICFCDAAMV